MTTASFSKRYAAPKVELIAIESQGVLCASGGDTSTGPTGNGLQFNTTSGTW